MNYCWLFQGYFVGKTSSSAGQGAIGKSPNTPQVCFPQYEISTIVDIQDVPNKKKY
jgi:hypothetical protein